MMAARCIGGNNMQYSINTCMVEFCMSAVVLGEFSECSLSALFLVIG